MLLFENMHMAYHHKKDVIIISKMLASCGLKVAILDLYKEDNIDNIDGIPVLHTNYTGDIPKEPQKSKSSILSLIFFIIFMIKKQRFLKKILNVTESTTKSYYVGSFGTTITSSFLCSNKPCFFWGLRSYFVDARYYLFRNPLKAFLIWINKILFIRNSNYFFVSNHLIKTEYEALGIPRERLIIRDERIVEKKEDDGDFNMLSNDFKYLVIGQLRPEKRVELTIDAFKKLRDKYRLSSSKLLLVGAAFIEYEKKISSYIDSDESIIRINEYLEDDFFYTCIKQANCLVFADKQMPHSITNGTFMEALINYRPVIAPNYAPYDYYINKYNIGILYNPDSEDSLVNALYEMKEKGTEHFYKNISVFLKTIDFKTSSRKLSEDILSIINNR